jgi:hypothetical protein
MTCCTPDGFSADVSLQPGMSRHLLARLASVLLVSVWTVTTQTSPSSALDATAALRLYEAGRYAEFFEATGRDFVVDRDGFKSFEAAANAWIRASDASGASRRRLIASSVALEFAHNLRHAPPDWAAESQRQHGSGGGGIHRRAPAPRG